MPRIARVVFKDIPHHITQRGNRCENVFFTDDDRKVYLEWLREYAVREGLEILAYCLMTNHIHLVVVPKKEESLQRVLKPLHTRYANRINQRFNWRGHFWQGRFFSSPLDENYMWAAVRYIERNPVRAKIMSRAEKYKWSSAAGHCGLHEDPLLTQDSFWQKKIGKQTNWVDWLVEQDSKDKLEILRRNINKNLPCGIDAFIQKLEKVSNRFLQFRAQGRPKEIQNSKTKR